MCNMNEGRRGEMDEGRLNGNNRKEGKRKVEKSIEEKKRDNN